MTKSPRRASLGPHRGSRRVQSAALNAKQENRNEQCISDYSFGDGLGYGGPRGSETVWLVWRRKRPTNRRIYGKHWVSARDSVCYIGRTQRVPWWNLAGLGLTEPSGPRTDDSGDASGRTHIPQRAWFFQLERRRRNSCPLHHGRSGGRVGRPRSILGRSCTWA